MRPVDTLKGLHLADGWIVNEIIHRPDNSTGGTFSVGYHVSRGKEEGYLKALDFMSAFQSPDWTVRMQEMLAEYNYERDISLRLSGIRRIVTSKGAGSIDVPGSPPPQNRVSYIIFELANGDIRINGYADAGRETIAQKLRSLHHVADGLSHLHSSLVTHQDVKPSNVFTFPGAECKVGDLGCSSDATNGSPNDRYQVAGDPGYLPPELDYPLDRSKQVVCHVGRKSLDLYHLGSLFYFVFSSGASARSELKYSMQTLGYSLSGNWSQDIAILVAAFSDSLSRLEQSLSVHRPNLAPRIIKAISELCNPDPEKRGNPKGSNPITRLNTQRYVSLIDNLAKRAEFGML